MTPSRQVTSEPYLPTSMSCLARQSLIGQGIPAANAC